MSNAASGPEGMHAPGSLFAGKYVVDRTLGQGGMGVVLAARHPHLHELVAIKCLLPEFANDPTVVARFVQEARSARRIRSEHVVRIDDVDTLPSGAPYIVMECLAGQNLEELVVSNGPLPVAVAVDYLGQALEAIAEAHALGIVHRDLKPANLFLAHRTDGSPCVKVLDFGISKVANAGMADGGMTKTSAMLGSPHYMSPEQIRSTRDVDPRSDIWAIGIILHELLTGTTPFDSESIPYLFVQIMQEPPPPLRTVRQDVPVALERAVTKCLEKDPARRFANVGELAAALAECGTASARASAERVVRVIHGHGATAAAFAPTGFAQPAVVLPQGFAYPSGQYTAPGTDPNGRPYAVPGPTNPNAVAPFPMDRPIPKRPNVALFAASGVAGVAILALVGVLAFNAGSHRDSDTTATATGATAAATTGATSPATAGSGAAADPAQPLAPLAPLATQGSQTSTAAAPAVSGKPHAVAAAQPPPSRAAGAAGSPAANGAAASAPAANTTAANTPAGSRAAPASDDDGDRPSAVHQFFNGLGHTVKRTVNQVTQ